jgi:hypothetical protein
MYDTTTREEGTMFAPEILDDMLRGAVETLLWSESDDNGVPFDDNADESDIDPDSLAMLREAIDGFAMSTPQDTLTMLNHYEAQRYITWSPAQMYGHDFALTSNGHGAGFWDRGESTGAADRLSAMCVASYHLSWSLDTTPGASTPFGRIVII